MNIEVEVRGHKGTRDAISEARRKVTTEASSWLRTPFVHGQRCKGVGVDCAMLLAEVYPRALGLPNIAVDFYPSDWHLHKDDERFMKFVMSYAQEIPEGKVGEGDIVLFKVGRGYAHSGIITAWPQIIHALKDRTVMLEDVLANSMLRELPRKFFSPFVEVSCLSVRT